MAVESSLSINGLNPGHSLNLYIQLHIRSKFSVGALAKYNCTIFCAFLQFMEMIGGGVSYLHSTLMWIVCWQLFLQLSPGGPREITTAYSINFWHGVLSTTIATLCILGYISETIAVPCSLGYFLVDFCNMLLNDLYHKVKSYHNSPQARGAEYFHHILCIVVCITSKLFYKSCCPSLTSDPVARIMLAEISTPFLITFRQSKNKTAGLLFVASFILSRTIHQCMFLMPEIFISCTPLGIKYGLVIPYILLQLYFTQQVVASAMRGARKRDHKIE